jgi:hypothetical protein
METGHISKGLGVLRLNGRSPARIVIGHHPASRPAFEEDPVMANRTTAATEVPPLKTDLD